MKRAKKREARGPGTIMDLMERFPDEPTCIAFLRKLRWPNGFVCPRCGERESVTIQTRRLEQCRSCRYQASITAGTVLHRTRKPLRLWFLAIFLIGRHKTGISALQLQKDLGLGSYKTAWAWLHKLRSTLAERPESRLRGLVEADETYVGAKNERGVLGDSTEPRPWSRRWWRIGANEPERCACRSCTRPRRRSSGRSFTTRSTPLARR